MAEYIRHKRLPKDYSVICTSDWHCGSRAFHQAAAEAIVERVATEKRTYMLFGGDAIEGKKIDSPHFDITSLNRDYARIHEQYKFIRKMWLPIGKKILAITRGNHDLYLSRDYDWVEELCREIGAPLGGYQTWVSLSPFLRVFMFHGRRSMPRGAKDPIQREANQKAWLKRELEPLAGDCHVMLMGHTHSLMVQAPIEQYSLLTDPKGDNVRAAYFREPDSIVETEHGKQPFVPERSRWYGNTGTLRRSGGFGYIDYAEVGGYPPSPIGYLEMRVENHRCVDIKKVVI